MRAALVVLVPLASCAPVELASHEQHHPIVGGQLAGDDEVGATVALLFGPDNEVLCSGTLVAPAVVVTAAHCTLGVDPAELRISAGRVDANFLAGDETLEAAAIVEHEGYSDEGNYTDDPDGLSNDRDLALVLLEEEAAAAPAPILPSGDVGDALHPGTLVVLAGYGSTDENDEGDYGRLYLAETPYIRRSSEELLAGAPGEPDTCGGDSGGPAYVSYGERRFLVGATSRAAWSSEAYCGDGTIYTLVSAFEPWIEANAEGLYEKPEDPEPHELEPALPGYRPDPPQACGAAPGAAPLPLLALLVLALRRSPSAR